MTHLSILIPVYNSEQTIAELCDSLIGLYTADYTLQIVLVNDGSADRSDEICRTLHQTYPQVITYVQLSRNFGEHNAVMAGLHFVKGDLCIIMDDDFQNPPEEIAALIDEMKKGYDVVYSSYLVNRNPIWRTMGSTFHNWMATLVLHKPLDLYLSSFKIINRFIINHIISYNGPEPYIDALILRTTRNIGQRRVAHQARRSGSSGYTLSKLISLWGSMLLSFSIYPLRGLTLTGFLMCIWGIYYYLRIVTQHKLPGGFEPDSYLLLKADLWLFRGVQLFATGMVAEYVGRIFRKSSAVPQYIIRDQLTHNPGTATDRVR